MFIITRDQEYILTILKKTRVMRTDQAIKILSAVDEGKNEQYVVNLLKQLQYMQKIAWKSETIFTMPLLYKEPVDEDMLSAIDIMADLTDFKIISLLSNSQPYKLCFYTEQEDTFGSYAVIIVSPGSETKIAAALCGTEAENRTIIFLLSEFSQKDSIKSAWSGNSVPPHFFAINDNGKYRYFEGGN